MHQKDLMCWSWIECAWIKNYLRIHEVKVSRTKKKNKQINKIFGV